MHREELVGIQTIWWVDYQLAVGFLTGSWKSNLDVWISNQLFGNPTACLSWPRCNGEEWVSQHLEGVHSCNHSIVMPPFQMIWYVYNSKTEHFSDQLKQCRLEPLWMRWGCKQLNNNLLYFVYGTYLFHILHLYCIEISMQRRPETMRKVI